MSGENKVLARDNRQLRSRLEYFEGKKTRVDLPIGLKGKVLAVDPKYEFVVLDVGTDQGALERGEMLINRSGRLVAKVRILSVQPNRSIANVLPEWKQAEIMEGDAAIVGL
jgi:cell shape-determining protein MreC